MCSTSGQHFGHMIREIFFFLKVLLLPKKAGERERIELMLHSDTWLQKKKKSLSRDLFDVACFTLPKGIELSLDLSNNAYCNASALSTPCGDKKSVSWGDESGT